MKKNFPTVVAHEGTLVNSYNDGIEDQKREAMVQALYKRRQKNMDDLAKKPGATSNALAKANGVQMKKPQQKLSPKKTVGI